MAQLVAHLHGMQGVRGSSPLSSTEARNPLTGHGGGIFAFGAGAVLDREGPTVTRVVVPPARACRVTADGRDPHDRARRRGAAGATARRAAS